MTLLRLAPCAAAKPYWTGKIVGQQNNRGFLYYLVNTPFTKDNPCYEASIRFN
jgi:hypothetical protein